MTMRREFRAAGIAAAAMAAAGCSSDPAFWEAVAMGLDQAAADLEYENAYCYWAPPPGLPYGANQRYCPGDYGYRDIYIPPDSSYWRRRPGRDHHDRDHRRDRDDDRGRDHGRRGKS
ncbi:MAG: hypothetical protein QME55_13185 [Brevundimonas sp.]|uniref:hypothetical protein n=1 Tax=Brevundimonas sp. TaxID=1871086 RepID=UPI002624F1D9|nr:hypothetical protein [Brevundimonas sp.]MDI6625680.1 hypothetical protein [Brevundimonas sp.]MDQ7811225.1 hypothetical protein [Brevundimonas sp.]